MRTCARTDLGRRRASNQDYVYCSENPVGRLPNLFLVADGMGGHQAGDYASRTAVEILLEKIRENETDTEPVTILRGAIERTNEELWGLSLSDDSLAGMGTTMVAAVLDEPTLIVMNVGDSRLYVSGRKLRQITRDHSLVEELVSEGRLVRGSEEYLSRKNVITRAVGVSPVVMADFFTVDLEMGERILLCSDGLANMVTDEEIQKIISRDLSVEEKTAALIEAANESGGRDNIAVVLVER